MENPHKNPKEWHWDHLNLPPNMELFLLLMLLESIENQFSQDTTNGTKLKVSITKWVD